jgi:hypothetical protein
MHVHHIFPLHRTPEKIILDRSTQFSARLMLELYRHLGIEHAMSTAFHPQSNGQTERTNQEVVKYLCMFCNEDQHGWAQLLPIAEFAYNSHVHLVTKSSPFELLYSYQPTWTSPLGTSAQMLAVLDQLAALHKARKEAKAALRMSKEAMQRDSKMDCSRPVFQPGNMVWLDTEDLNICTKSEKLVDKQVRCAGKHCHCLNFRLIFGLGVLCEHARFPFLVVDPFWTCFYSLLCTHQTA